MSSLLPTGFEALEPFTDQWAVATTAQRAALRGESSAHERRAFYDAIASRIVEVLDYLDERGMAHYDAADKRLLNIALSFAHVAIAVETQREDEEAHAASRKFMRITRSPTDVITA